MKVCTTKGEAKMVVFGRDSNDGIEANGEDTQSVFHAISDLKILQTRLIDDLAC